MIHDLKGYIHTHQYRLGLGVAIVVISEREATGSNLRIKAGIVRPGKEVLKHDGERPILHPAFGSHHFRQRIGDLQVLETQITTVFHP